MTMAIEATCQALIASLQSSIISYLLEDETVAFKLPEAVVLARENRFCSQGAFSALFSCCVGFSYCRSSHALSHKKSLCYSIQALVRGTFKAGAGPQRSKTVVSRMPFFVLFFAARNLALIHSRPWVKPIWLA